MRILILLLISVFYSGCVLNVGNLEFREEHIDANIARFTELNANVTGPFVKYSGKFDLDEDGLTQDQINSIVGYVVYENSKFKSEVALDRRSFISNQVMVGGRICFRIGLIIDDGNNVIRTLPGNAEVCGGS